MVIGGGSGGMEYALAVHAAGHEVVVYEKGTELGGVMNWAGGDQTLPNMEQIAYQPQYHCRMIAKHGIAIQLGVEVSAETVLAERPDVVVVATGAGEGIELALDLARQGRAARLRDARAQCVAEGAAAMHYAIIANQLLHGQPTLVPANMVKAAG